MQWIRPLSSSFSCPIDDASPDCFFFAMTALDGCTLVTASSWRLQLAPVPPVTPPLMVTDDPASGLWSVVLEDP
ncbi:hypothetical protein GOP47_0010720 [Adiantum capillus-veneris]|uniref:Uncharacterized protein n=1 Tax=Adiantum capillus-veneris TaxID=13818 RepID=A0A9D4UVT8_ADICA|nr:hypothetical protein GOP47_0010720 [Adiantum capillus-veneris]